MDHTTFKSNIFDILYTELRKNVSANSAGSIAGSVVNSIPDTLLDKSEGIDTLMTQIGLSIIRAGTTFQ